MDQLLQEVIAGALHDAPRDALVVRLAQRGELRLKPDGPWLPFRARQSIHCREPSFRWEAKVKMAPLLRVHVVDAYENGRGRLDARLWRLIRLARARGPETDGGELLRYLAELPWCPHAYVLNPSLRFEARSGTRLRVACASESTTVSVDLTVDGTGDVVRAQTDTRLRLEGKRPVPRPWFGVFSDHRTVGGLRVPARGAVSWVLEDGPFEYFRGEITALEVDCA
ncbi:MAG: DUF6920 family protein [Planctomycetota bacterium]